MFGIQITLLDIVDILLFAFILFGVYRVLRSSGATNLFWGVFAFVIAWILLRFVFHFSLTGALFDRIISVGAIALIVIFQEEIRAFVYRLGSQISSRMRLRMHTRSSNNVQNLAMQIVRACQHMSQSKTGALIIFAGNHDLRTYIDTGEKIDAQISSRLVENIFFKNSPLHDGALIVSNNRLTAAGCILPVSKNPDLPLQYGLRHRAALGIAEISGVTAIVVSEETGRICVAEGGTLPQGATIREIDETQILSIISAALEM